MSRQLTFGDAEYAGKRKQTKRERFLAEMDRVVPWAELVAVIEPHWPKGQRGRPPFPLETMLRIHLMQQWYALSDPAMEEALYEIVPMRQFAGLSLLGAVPDETTILAFRHRLEEHGLAKRLFEAVAAHLAGRNLYVKQGTIVDATIIHASGSTKNAGQCRDPEMHQTRKGKQWYFGMKLHVGCDLDTGLVHSLATTAANAADVAVGPECLRGDEPVVFGDAGYIGLGQRLAPGHAPTLHVAEKRGRVKAITDATLKDLTIRLERAKASLRAKVEHVFRVIKVQFGYRKVRYRGLEKNTGQLQVLVALTNLYLARRHLLAATG
jgi:IS5 family transposase